MEWTMADFVDQNINRLNNAMAEMKLSHFLLFIHLSKVILERNFQMNSNGKMTSNLTKS